MIRRLSGHPSSCRTAIVLLDIRFWPAHLCQVKMWEKRLVNCGTKKNNKQTNKKERMWFRHLSAYVGKKMKKTNSRHLCIRAGAPLLGWGHQGSHWQNLYY